MLEHAGCWFLQSGIQAPSGGVARFYQSDSGIFRPVSSEITGYAASALLYLGARTGNQAYRDAGLRAARFLAEEAWDAALNTVNVGKFNLGDFPTKTVFPAMRCAAIATGPP